MDRSPPSAGELEDRILPWSQVRIISGLSRTTVWRLQKTGDFPAAVQVSRNRVGWWQSELLEWKRSRTHRRLPPPLPPPPGAERVSRPRPPPVSDAPLPGERETLLRHRATTAAPRRGRRPAPVAPGQGAFDF